MSTENNIRIRTLQRRDDPVIAAIIRNTLAEFGADRPGTVFADKATDHLSELFAGPGKIYYVALTGDEITGGAGIHPLEGAGGNICELQKMYLLPQARGKGIGRLLIQKCLAFAGEQGYEKCYLETMPELSRAISIYEKSGFRYLSAPLGNTGHFGCGLWMIKDLT